MSDDILLTGPEMAKALGITYSALSYAVKDGRVPPPQKKPGTKKSVWPLNETMAKYKANTSELRSSARAGKKRAPVEAEPEPVKSSVSELNRKKLEIDIATRALHLQRMKDVLVDKQKVYNDLFAFAALMREKLEAIPDRIVDDLRAAADRDEAHNLLSVEIKNVLIELAEVKI